MRDEREVRNEIRLRSNAALAERIMSSVALWIPAFEGMTVKELAATGVIIVHFEKFSVSGGSSTRRAALAR